MMVLCMAKSKTVYFPLEYHILIIRYHGLPSSILRCPLLVCWALSATARCSAPLSVISFPPSPSQTSPLSWALDNKARARAFTPSSPMWLQPSCRGVCVCVRVCVRACMCIRVRACVYVCGGGWVSA